MESKVLETIIYGRVEPHIYAFQTQKVPRYTKVGDTYRPTEIRLKEWERIIGSELTTIFDEPAFADSMGDVYFRDYSVHSYLEGQKGKHRLTKNDPEGNPWFSNEFFIETEKNDIDEAIQDIVESYSNGNPRGYDFYSTIDKSHTETIERLHLDYKPRDNQKEVIDRFKARYNPSKKKISLLMYAVMRFGKSFTALQCALAMDSKFVIVVSAKTDVKDSWKSTLYEHKDFDEYVFLDAKNLLERNFNLKNEIASGKRFVLFLSLQDLSGKDVKEKHKQIFQLKEPSTLLIVDETHFGARASEYGQVLRNSNAEDSVRKEDLGDTDTADKLDVIKNFENVRVRIHLSGTPYRILMNGEFSDNDIISFVQYGDIVKAQKQWDKEHFAQDNSTSEEWDNPYFGFPEMVRFAFHPNQESIDLIREMKHKGAGGLSELFSPVSVEKMEQPEFKHHDMVLGLVQAIDGTKMDNNIFPFLDYTKIQEGNMCHHMVWVLPFQSSCDAMEHLLKNETFAKLNDYEIINISGYNCPKAYSGKNAPTKVKEAIASFEKQGKKTITLTVQRMLTGSTVPEWDTMLFLKDTSSPQEYDQATFRIQNPYIKTVVTTDGNDKEKKIKINMKPQTLLVDFDPARMFRMQEAKSEFYQGDDAKGNNDLKRRIEEDLEISPIIYVEQDKLVRVEANSVIKAVREYSKSRSVLDEANLIPSDNSLLDDKHIRAVIGALDALNNKKGLEFNPFEGDGTALEGLNKLLKTLKEKNKNKSSNKDDDKLSEEEILKRKLKTFYASILMFAFLSDTQIKYLDDIIAALESRNSDDIRIANNLGINVNILKIVREKASQNARHHLDNRIENIHDLMRNNENDPLQRAKIALTKFDRLSASEIVTPQGVLDVLIEGIPNDKVEGNNPVFLDLASKQGELTIAFLQKYPEANKENIYSVTTSSVAYEMTRKVYKALGIPASNVILPPKSGDNYYEKLYFLIIDTLGTKKPNIILCCPPFQKPKGGGRGDGGADIYPCYYCLCKRLNPNDSEDSDIPFMFGMYTKATWNTHETTFIPGSDTESDVDEEENNDECGEIKIPDFRKMMLTDNHIFQLNDYLNAKPFYSKNQTVTLRGGVNIFFCDNKPVETTKANLFIDCNKKILEEERLLLPTDIKDLMIVNGIVDVNSPDFPYVRIGSLGLSILEKVLRKVHENNLSFIKVRPRNIFKITENIEKNYTGKPKADDGVKVYVQKGNWMYIAKPIVKAFNTQENLVNAWKVVAAKGSSGEDVFPHAIISQPRVVEAGAVCSDTYLVIKDFTGDDAEQNARAFAGYMKSEFFRFMMLLAKNDHNLTRHCYRFVPDIPCDQYINVYDYFGIEPEEQEFISKFIKKWESEDTIGVCLNSEEN